MLLPVQVTGWITAKVTVVSDESYRDPTNLQGKMQKHQAFEAELSANKRRIDLVHAVGRHSNHVIQTSSEMFCYFPVCYLNKR